MWYILLGIILCPLVLVVLMMLAYGFIVVYNAFEIIFETHGDLKLSLKYIEKVTDPDELYVIYDEEDEDE